MQKSGIRFVLVLVIFAIGLSTQAPRMRVAQAQNAPQGASHDSTLVDDYQTTYLIDRYREIADGGPARGQNIYFFKCFVCHNQYAKGGPPLKDLYQQQALHSGEAVDDDSVASQIKNGSSGMPGFGNGLNDKDIADVISYLKSGKCCYEAENPPANPRYQAENHKWAVQSGLTGGATGAVRSSGGPLEGIKVQLIAPNGVRTTVMTNEEGKYEFPLMQAGTYKLRIATPAPYKAYDRDAVQIDKASKIDDIVLERIPNMGGPGALPGALPPIPEVESQLSGSEMLWNLPGTDEEKAAFAKGCGGGCHSYQQILRNRFDERSWRIMVDRMLGYAGNDLVVRRDKFSFASDAEAEIVIKWLARVRGPESKDGPLRVFPRSSGASTRVVITEYELPRRMLTIHDVYGDSKGNIWYTSHRSPYAGILDPRTGIVKEYKVPLIPGSFPGTHHVVVDKNDIGWYSENWAHNLTRLDPKTGEFRQMFIDTSDKINTAGFSNFAMTPDGYVWHGYNRNEIAKIDPETGKVAQAYPLKNNPTPYDNIVSADGRFWAGGSPPGNGYNTAMIMDIRTGKMVELNSGDLVHSAARGGFDPEDNGWFGGRDGVFVEIVNELDKGKGAHIRNYWPPTPYFPYTVFYSAVPDHNGEVWGGVLHGLGFVRFNPKTGRWWVYNNAEPSALARDTWIDNSTNPVTIWYADYHTGYVVRIQPRE